MPDPPGEALHFLELRSAFYCRSEFTVPFGLELPPLEDYLCRELIAVLPGILTFDPATSPTSVRSSLR